MYGILESRDITLPTKAWVVKVMVFPVVMYRCESWTVKKAERCLFNLYAEYIKRNTGLDEAQAGIKIARRNINNLRYADDTTLMVESEEELKPLDESERGEWKSWLKAQYSEN